MRAISTGALIWLFIFIIFAGLSYVSTIKDSVSQQALIVAIFIIPFALFGASIFYKNRNKVHGLISGSIMSLTAILLDALITVPFVEIPKGGGMKAFLHFLYFGYLLQ
jgi:hypothetical protein